MISRFAIFAGGYESATEALAGRAHSEWFEHHNGIFLGIDPAYSGVIMFDPTFHALTGNWQAIVGDPGRRKEQEGMRGMTPAARAAPSKFWREIERWFG